MFRVQIWFILALSAYTYLNTVLLYTGTSISALVVLCRRNYIYHRRTGKRPPAGTTLRTPDPAAEEQRSAQGFSSWPAPPLQHSSPPASFFFAGMVLHDHTVSKTIVPLKLNLIYAWLASLLLFTCSTRSNVLFYPVQKQVDGSRRLKRISAQNGITALKNQDQPAFPVQ